MLYRMRRSLGVWQKHMGASVEEMRKTSWRQILLELDFMDLEATYLKRPE